MRTVFDRDLLRGLGDTSLYLGVIMSREESLKLALHKMREAKTAREYAQAMIEHLNRFKSPALVGMSSHSDYDILNAPLLQKLGD